MWLDLVIVAYTISVKISITLVPSILTFDNAAIETHGAWVEWSSQCFFLMRSGGSIPHEVHTKLYN